MYKRTALHGEHVRAGAKMVPFAEFEMPVQYSSILKEHDAVRHRAGLFDLSHMAQFWMTGDLVARWADTLTINAVGTMKPLQARYNIFCNEGGGAHDDTIFYRLEKGWLLVVNASNAEKMWELLQHADPPPGVALENRQGRFALIAIQGPRSVEMLQPHADVDLAALRYYFCAEGRIDGVPAIVARTGYTGEDGFELFVGGEEAPRLWNALLDAHRREGLEACGLGARDVLRLEAGMPLYGHELTESITPIQAGLKWALKLDKPEFVGKDALREQLESDAYSRIVGLVMEGRVPAREGYQVWHDGRIVGSVRSGSIAPSVGNKNVATALVAPECASPGARLEVEIRGKNHEATVVPMPFYKRPK